ncbi:MAG: hypothetical protein K9H84_00415 [Bacteroidales bacterium]|nr:hypothetical protein [Bacteroidales bacterium]
MKKLIISILFLVFTFYSTEAQVSGSNGNRMIGGLGISPDPFGWLFENNEYTTGVQLDFDYVITRNSSLGLLLDFDNVNHRYSSFYMPGMGYNYGFRGVSDPFVIHSSLFELNYKLFTNGQIAPIGSYWKVSGGILSVGHEFDKEEFTSQLYDRSDLTDVSEFDDMVVKDNYIVPFIGIGFGETFPVLMENLYFDIGGDIRFFLKRDIFLNQLFDEYPSITKENLLEYNTCSVILFNKFLNIKITLRYAF